MNAYILLKTTNLGSFIACVIAEKASEALAKLREGMDKTRYRTIGFDDVLKDDWIITPPDQLTERDLIKVPANTVVGSIIDNAKRIDIFSREVGKN
nr:hypothetical protein [Candidatus Sigynarchaeota archaeon]